MKFGVNSWIWVAPLTTDEVARLAPLAKQLGAEWFEVPLEDTSLIDYARAGAIIRDLGMGTSVCAAMGPDRDLIHPDSAIQQSGMAYLRHCIDAVKALGGTNVCGPLYSAVGRVWQSTPDERARDLDLLVRQLGSLAGYAADHGAVLCIEPLNRFETSFINLAAQAIEVVERVNHPACQIMLDTFHMNVEEKSLGDAIRAVGPRLQHFHACENDRGAPGSGHVPWAEIADALKDIHYNGPVVIESFTAKVQSIARAAAIWRSLAPTQDALAQDGLAFLRKAFA
ncbi:MAG: sugar phosphate isomerase/epimerase [Chloroflexi bacterium]|jgi:D-psicose/D-tagatose/L-ribulose 3-epimerase|nr:sugar phosphate isomerase/epimerase [Chloroflexota bacterium]